MATKNNKVKQYKKMITTKRKPPLKWGKLPGNVIKNTVILFNDYWKNK